MNTFKKQLKVNNIKTKKSFHPLARLWARFFVCPPRVVNTWLLLYTRCHIVPPFSAESRAAAVLKKSAEGRVNP